ncbi:MAG: phenylacetate--CoA ligase [Alphaproteobacteria bacterium]|nr:phenylacetate--CoA ligase [Alphaproteobacteria bacterium]
MVREYPIGDDFFRLMRTISRDELRALQEKRFLKLVERGWQIPFYRRRWQAKGIEAGDIRRLEDCAKLPTYSKSDLMESMASYPPFGDFHGIDSFGRGGVRPPVVLHTTSGTTGMPQPLFFGPWSRELQNLMLARVYHAAGLRPDDVVHSVYGHGMINGGHYVRETVLHFTNSLFLSAGTGNETRSAQQVQLMKQFGVTVIIGFADYIKKLAQVADEEGIKPGRDIKIRLIIGHMGRESKEAISEAWGGAQVYDWYGVGDTGLVAFEAPDRDGMYVMEDGHYLEILDPDTNRPLADGEQGNMCVTVLFKDDIYPCIRFDTKDVTAVKTAASPSGFNFRRIEGFLGRSDNMVKLRGINLYPIAIGAVVNEHPATAGEYICVATRDATGRDELTITVEVRDPADQALREELRDRLKARFGIDIQVDLAARGGTAHLTEVERRQKAIRLIDKRFS